MNDDHEAGFLTTQWTCILGSEEGSTDSRSKGLIRLCEAYHRPVYAFIRHRCRDPEKARDLCQGFFQMLVETRFYEKADRAKGRFRTYLLAAVKNFLKEEYRSRLRQKRGGDKVHFSLDLESAESGFRGELARDAPDEAGYDHDWALAVFERVWGELRREYEEAGHLDRFEVVRPLLVDPSVQTPYSELAGILGLSENGVKTVVSRMKARFRVLFRAVVGQLVDHPSDIDDEIHYLIQCTAKDPYR
ncbi:sigma factor [Verrucomicrobiaceae bacterium 227]